MTFNDLEHTYKRCADCGIIMSDITGQLCTSCRRKWHEKEVAELTSRIERLESGLRGIKREFGHQSINNGASTLGLFIDMLIKNDVAGAKLLKEPQ